MNLSPIESEHLAMHPLRVSDAGEMVSILGDVSLYEFTGGEPPSRETLEIRYRQQVAGSGTPEEAWCNWIIRTNPTGRAVGFVQATVVGCCADLAWVVGAADQGRGIATEAAEAVCEWLADNDVDRFEAHIHPHHVASQTVAARIGMIRTGETDSDDEEIWAIDRS